MLLKVSCLCLSFTGSPESRCSFWKHLLGRAKLCMWAFGAMMSKTVSETTPSFRKSFFLAVAMKWTARIFLQWQVKLLPKHQIFLACCSVRRWFFLGSQKVFLHPSHVGKSTLETRCFSDSQGMDLQIILRICLRISLQIEQMEHSGMQTWPCVVIWMLMITTNGGSLAEFVRVNFSGFSLLSCK